MSTGKLHELVYAPHTLRIRGFNVPAAPQTVYWSAHAGRR
jgi:hypothetical protein